MQRDGTVPVEDHGPSQAPVRYVLKNRRYLGDLVWNQRKFIEDSKSGKRKPVKRPVAELVSSIRPELAIVDHTIFAAAQARFRKTPQRGTVGSTRVHAPHALAGILKCAVCSGNFTIYVWKESKGGVDTCCRCATFTNRPDQCTNRWSINVEELSAELFDRWLENAHAKPGVIETAVQRLTDEFMARQTNKDAHSKAELAVLAPRIANLMAAVGAVGPTPEILAAHSEACARRDELLARAAEAPPRRTWKGPAPP